MGNNEWVSTTLGELVDTFGGSVQTGPFGSQLHAADYVSEGIPSVMPKNIKIEEIDVEDIAKVSLSDAERLKKYQLAEGDIVYSRRGDVEKCALVTKNEANWLCGTGCLRIRIPRNKSITPYFLHAFLSTPVTREWVSRHAIGATMPNLNTSILRDVPIVVPPFDSMNFIGAMWIKLNRKIILNRKINQTLEQMSQTLFKSWFVDFDPVIDNALDAGNSIPEVLQSRVELRQKVRNSADFKPLTADIRTLFPAEFEETELGCVPKGWVTNRLENILELAYGKALKKTERTNGDYPVYGSGGVDGTHNEYLVKGPGIIVGRKGTVGSLHWENKDFYPIDTVFFVKPKEYYSLVYCHQLLKTLGLENMNTDAAVPGLNRNNAYRLEVVTPTQSIITKFTNIIQTIQHKMDSNHNETENLTALRDTLLPKLISGELSLEDLPDLIKQTEAA
ncbi:restriction endonuclease subunit S [Enterobacter bugandensis]|uniref:restriction endonuclease subunit S n=1 Tax=Enterobacter bugandensis TaxID=881260 RepID=UPI0009E2A000|nr:restriction endonuclease subunit S [Enterobacter bugandensis]EMC1016189.1 restriction endonuclease subunit S [Enterobacter bugandensis]